jgi:hypothetical protein
MATIHISESEAARNFAGIREKVRVGAEFVIESEGGVVAVVRQPDADFRPRLLSDCIAAEKALEAETGDSPVFDAEFADDLAEVISNRKPWNPPAWD